MNLFSAGSGESRGITLLEVIISMMIFSLIFFSAAFIFRESLLRFGKDSGGKKVYSEIASVLNYLERYVSAAMCGGGINSHRIDFKGERNTVRFAAPFSEGDESDIAKFAFYFEEGKVKVSLLRISRRHPDFTFPEDFSGAQVLGENIGCFELEYLDGNLWKDSWDTREMEEPRLPGAIKVKITAHSEKIEGERIEKKVTKIINIGW